MADEFDDKDFTPSERRGLRAILEGAGPASLTALAVATGWPGWVAGPAVGAAVKAAHFLLAQAQSRKQQRAWQALFHIAAEIAGTSDPDKVREVIEGLDHEQQDRLLQWINVLAFQAPDEALVALRAVAADHLGRRVDTSVARDVARLFIDCDQLRLAAIKRALRQVGPDRQIGERFLFNLNARQRGAYNFAVERLKSLGRAEGATAGNSSATKVGAPTWGCRLTDQEFCDALSRYAELLAVDEESLIAPTPATRR